MVAVLAAWPWIARSLIGSSEDNGLSGTFFLAVVSDIDWAVSAVVAPFANLLRGTLPSYAGPWVDIALYYPSATSLLVAIALWVWNKNGALRDTIQERARLAWNRPRRMASLRHVDKAGPLLRFARWMRLNAGPVHRVFAWRLVPAVFLLAIFGAAYLVGATSFFTGRVALGEVCSPPEIKGSGREPAKLATGTPVPDVPIDAKGLFDTSDFCWWSGLAVEKGRKYRVWIQIEDHPWFDRTIMAGVNGFKTYEGHHYVALPSRRLISADWFQPVVRIGTKGMNDLPLQAINVEPADELPRRMMPTLPAADDLDKSKNRYPVRLEDVTELKEAADTEKLNRLKPAIRSMSTFDPLPKDETACKAWEAQKLTDRMAAEFVASDSGELFFYVNDALQLLPHLPSWMLPSKIAPYFGPYDQYYRNNSGTARIKVQRLPAPSMPPDRPAVSGADPAPATRCNEL
jgi:hypothetical protein